MHLCRSISECVDSRMENRQNYDQPGFASDSDILFSKSVKAGKRIYYIDVKRDRHDEIYLSLTESKRIKDGTEDCRPVFEKHKIFLYREDIEKFIDAFDEASAFALASQPEVKHQRYFRNEDDSFRPSQQHYAEEEQADNTSRNEIGLGDFDF